MQVLASILYDFKKSSYLFTLWSVFLFYSTSLPASQVIDQSDLEFQTSIPLMLKDNILYSSKLAMPEDVPNLYPVFTDLDFKQVSQIENSRILLTKYAFITDKPIQNFSRKHIFSGKDFEKITKNIEVRNESVQNKNLLTFDMDKRILMFSIKAKVSFEYFDLNEVSHSPFWKLQDYHDEQIDILTLQTIDNYSRIFNRSSNLCAFIDLKEHHSTMMECYMMSAVKESAFKSIGKIVNFTKQLRKEILYTIDQIK